MWEQSGWGTKPGENEASINEVLERDAYSSFAWKRCGGQVCLGGPQDSPPYHPAFQMMIPIDCPMLYHQQLSECPQGGIVWIVIWWLHKVRDFATKHLTIKRSIEGF